MKRRTKDIAPVTLGEKYRDSVTGYTGTATARTEYMFGCVRVMLEGSDKDGKPDDQHFDEQRLVLAATGETPKPTATSGGPGAMPPSRDVARW